MTKEIVVVLNIVMLLVTVGLSQSYIDRFSDEQILNLYKLFDRYHTEEHIIQNVKRDVMKDSAIPQFQKQSEIERIKAKSEKYRQIFLDSLIEIGGQSILQYEDQITERAQDILIKNYTEERGEYGNNGADNWSPDASYETEAQYNKLVEFEDRTLSELDSINQLISNASDDSTRERLIKEREEMLKRHRIESLRLKIEIAKQMGDEQRVKSLEEILRKEMSN
ncbi:hypothetical protein DRQ33_07165 [bacterium]|mgnify:CR=1 FL=1|nr:MAG: hypothetical protein DRQ33_07165 [bacterium]